MCDKKEKHSKKTNVPCYLGPRFRFKPFTFSGKYTLETPEGVWSYVVRMWGGGGAGGSTVLGGNAGAGGAFLSFTLDTRPKFKLFLTVGQGGIGSANTNPGPNGEDTRVEGKGFFAIASGGQGGPASGQAAGGQPLLVGIPDECAVRIPGQPGGTRFFFDGPTGGAASGGGGIGFPYFSEAAQQPGGDGQTPGSGGGGASDNTVPGGNGGNGQIEFYYIQV